VTGPAIGRKSDLSSGMKVDVRTDHGNRIFQLSAWAAVGLRYSSRRGRNKGYTPGQSPKPETCPSVRSS
jgi:hypothetical protein